MKGPHDEALDAFRRDGSRHLIMQRSPGGDDPSIPFESVKELSNLLAELEAKRWWGGFALSAGFLWHVNAMREAAGLLPLALLPNRLRGTAIVEIPREDLKRLGYFNDGSPFYGEGNNA